MPLSLLLLFRLRRLGFAIVAVILTGSVWLLMMDIVMRYPRGSVMLKWMEIWYGQYPMFSHGIRGMMGIYPASLPAHWLSTGAGLLAFILSQWFLLRSPGEPWRVQLLATGPMPPLVRAMGALPMAVLTVGASSMVLEALRFWGDLPLPRVYVLGFKFYPTAWIALILLLGSWWGWTRWLKRRWAFHDRYVQLGGLVYYLFVASGLLLLLGGFMQILSVGFVGNFWENGSYTAMGTSLSVMLWTLAPALTLVYYAGDYQREGRFATLMGTA